MKYPTTIVLNKKDQAKIALVQPRLQRAKGNTLSLASIQEWQEWQYAAPLLLYAHSPAAHVCKLANLFEEIISSVMAILHL
jgi:hypothetical protein